MRLQTAGNILLVLVLMVALLCGGLLHAFIPHAHGAEHRHDGQGETSSAIWSSLHGVLSHDLKKSLLDISVYGLEVLFSIASVVLLLPVLSVHKGKNMILRSRSLFSGILLRRGIHKYRRFG